MLDIKFIRQHPEETKKRIAQKGIKVDVDKLLKIDKEKLVLQQKAEILRATLHKLGKDKIAERKKISAQLKNIESDWEKTKEEFIALMLMMPNLPASDVKIGQSEQDNEIIKTWREPTKFTFKPLSYIEIGERLDIIDTQRAAKVSGTRFGYLKGLAAQLEFALINFTLRTLLGEGFIPIVPPVLIKKEAMQAMGYLERGEQEMFKIEKDNLCLVGTSEQAIGPMHMNEIFREKDLPKRYVAFSTCFRREAGASGKDTRGILRVHQFDKVEMFSFTAPEDADKEHDYLLSLEEKIVQALKIPYRVVKMCTADLGDPAARKYDIECWLPSQNTYRETHSTSNCTDFQARRLNIRYKNKKRQNLFVHTLNGTAVAIGRMIIMILENYQQAGGKIQVPVVLQPFLP